MNRRDVIKSGAAGLAVSMLGAHVAGAEERKMHRVGLIGAGWYGKNDLMRLIQVAPVEVVSICDVDKHQAAEAADISDIVALKLANVFAWDIDFVLDIAYMRFRTVPGIPTMTASFTTALDKLINAPLAFRACQKPRRTFLRSSTKKPV